MTELRLFDVPAAPAVDPSVRLSADARRTQRRRAQLAAGIHPATGRPLLNQEGGYRCRDCVHCVLITSNGNRAWWKCERHLRGITHGPGTDIRVGWPACTLLRLDDATAVTDTEGER